MCINGQHILFRTVRLKILNFGLYIKFYIKFIFYKSVRLQIFILKFKLWGSKCK